MWVFFCVFICVNKWIFSMLILLWRFTLVLRQNCLRWYGYGCNVSLMIPFTILSPYMAILTENKKFENSWFFKWPIKTKTIWDCINNSFLVDIYIFIWVIWIKTRVEMAVYNLLTMDITLPTNWVRLNKYLQLGIHKHFPPYSAFEGSMVSMQVAEFIMLLFFKTDVCTRLGLFIFPALLEMKYTSMVSF